MMVLLLASGTNKYYNCPRGVFKMYHSMYGFHK